MNAPEAGTIRELLVNEEDTVTVGQDLVKLETGGEAPSSGAKEAKGEAKEAASKDQQTSSQPEGEQEQSKPKEEEQHREDKPEPLKQESKPVPPPSEPALPKQSKDTTPKTENVFGSREERRVSMACYFN